MVHWDRLGQPKFDRLINALVDRRHDDAGDDVQVIDGRGGDGGLDIRVVTAGSRELIYQLKYFPNGFDGRYRDSRRQITDSLERALQTCPELDEWILVAPCTATRPGWAFIEALRAQHPAITITFVDRSRLDSQWVAAYPDVVRAIISRDETLEKAAIYNTEKSVLAGGLPDLLKRHKDLDQVSRDAHPDWFWTVRTDGPHQVAELHPRHARAAERSPFSIHFDTKGPPDDPDLKHFADAIRYGPLEPARLPARLLSEVVIDGPDIVKSGLPGEIIELRFVPDLPEDQERPLTLEIDTDETSTTIHHGLITRAAQGSAGATMRQAFTNGAVVLTWRLPNEQPGPAFVDMTVNLKKARSAYELWSVTRLLLSWSSFNQMRMLLNGKVFAVLGQLKGALEPELLDAAIVLNEFTDDLLFIGREFDRDFVVPEAVSQLDRIDARIFRRILEGRVVCLPFETTINVTLTPAALEDDQWGEERSVVALFPADDPRDDRTVEPGSSYWTLDALKAQGAVAEFVLDEQMGQYFPQMSLEDAVTVQGKLAQGEDAPARLSSGSDLRPRIYLPARMGPDQQISPEPWGLYGIEEVPELAATLDIGS
ncbi:hypothetical protein [Janibacter melonis]|uniref:hypothetical protein n=1 Tax=Janibacter melonis TaxID=262209 RepID=UPI001E576187|nr:hypothetical protein [Janibacter melonis]MCB5991730.1 hypothetical protein [Janibacter melonis]